ncbi:ribonuclease domain-containing protein [Deinococcus sp.]|uniref:ribonuclease domain-containing protein n=1 Tax=Deinococcus sp. TaxID=47478 RepID=UPI003CC635E3
MKFASRAAPLLAALTLCACHSPGQTATQPPTTQPQPTQTRTAPTTDPLSGLDFVALSALPVQGQQTYRLIVQGGPFPYSRDGVAYQNREGVLPQRQRGTYHEYTVPTPGSSDRGARRIVCAAAVRTAGPECYYTADHYASFQRIRR